MTTSPNRDNTVIEASEEDFKTSVREAGYNMAFGVAISAVSVLGSAAVVYTTYKNNVFYPIPTVATGVPLGFSLSYTIREAIKFNRLTANLDNE